MPSKIQIKTTIQLYVDALDPEVDGVLDLQRALGDPSDNPILLRGETVNKGIAYEVPGFLDSLLQGLSVGINVSFPIIFGGKGAFSGTQYLVPGYDEPRGNELLIPMPLAATLTYASLVVKTAPGASSTSTFTVRKNGGNTTAVLSISGASDKTDVWSGSVVYQTGNTLSVKYTETGEANSCANAILSLGFDVS